jgi:hypothetical protein
MNMDTRRMKRAVVVCAGLTVAATTGCGTGLGAPEVQPVRQPSSAHSFSKAGAVHGVGQYVLPTDGWRPGEPSLLALNSGAFYGYSVKGVACAGFGPRAALYWPAGYRLRLNPTELVDQSGRVVARQGQKIYVGGGIGVTPHDMPCFQPGQQVFRVMSGIHASAPTATAPW